LWLPKTLKDNENLSTAVLSCKEFASVAGTESYRNVLVLVFWNPWWVRDIVI
jgi:hypothetical protein